ncbi:hypothetical protein WUBG_17693, partial [Wuchereria bancrofti]
MKFWVAEIHEIVKNTILHYSEIRTKCGELNNALKQVEPLLLKDWSAVMDWTPHADHKGEYLQLWNSHNLDKAVAQSQSFINECRRALEIRTKCGVLNNALKQ